MISSDELCDALSEIDSEDICTKKKGERKRALLRDQINIRKKLKQKIQISLTHNRRQRPLREIVCELSTFIDENSDIPVPESLVGKRLLHKFDVEGQEKWFSGYVTSYNACSNTPTYEVSYEEENLFNLIEDISVGDVTVITLITSESKHVMLVGQDINF